MLFAYLVKTCNVCPTKIGRITLPQLLVIFKKDSQTKQSNSLSYPEVLALIRQQRAEILAANK